MAADATFFHGDTDSDAISDGDWSDPLDLGTVNIPESGDAHTAGAQVTLKNTGDTQLQGGEVSAIDGSGQTATVYDDRVSFAPDNAGSPGTWGNDGDPYTLADTDMDPNATETFWVRTRADSGDTQPSNPVNLSLQLDATSV